ncbi:DMT family transporter [Variovorax sp. YR216]|uniref:DMT family transporter n=1 Tax=Variovorax sp. YR216 TaxID=1882828 RepID=UPI0008943D0B|nr:DMT family transporter [Variovorax sp. YR216]SEA86077.1 Permease of the drug/metabolite transporter (DMT) superfamily [Variovorax sp. YR216]
MSVETSNTAGRQALAVQMTLIAAMAIWGLNVAVVKQLTHSFDTSMLAALRMVVALAVLSAILLWKRCVVRDMSWKQVRTLLVCGVLMVYLNQLLFAEGLQRSTATNGALIMALSPLVSAVLAAFMFRESLSVQRMLGVALGFGGVAAVVLSHPGAGLSRASTGDLMLVAGVVSFAAGGALVQRLAKCLHPLTISWAIYLVGTSMLVVQAAVGSPSLDLEVLFPGWWQWALILFSGVMATALSNLLWNRAIASIGVARTAVFLYWVPVFGVLFAAILLDERLTAWHLAGFVAVMAGTYLGTRQQPATPSSST